MTQKIIKVGSSAAVTLSRETLGALGLDIGDRVEVATDAVRRKIVVVPSVQFNPELVSWTRNFIRRYRKALDALARQ
ncbi:MAG: hypothetical protein Q8R39_02555 [bacterium]|nr:hypothetical protein [bacterium]